MKKMCAFVALAVLPTVAVAQTRTAGPGLPTAPIASDTGFGPYNSVFFTDPGWFPKNPGNGSISVDAPNQITVVGDDSGLLSSFTGLNFEGICPPPNGNPECILTFTLNSYTSGDSGQFDLPVLKVGDPNTGVEQLFSLPHPNGGTVANDNQLFTPATYEVTIPQTPNSVVHFGLGVFSVDGIFGPGTAVYSDVSLKKVPEPATMALLGIGGLLALRRRRA